MAYKPKELVMFEYTFTRSNTTSHISSSAVSDKWFKKSRLSLTEFLCISVLRVASGPRVKLASCKSALFCSCIFSVLLALRLPRLGKRKLILVLFVRLSGKGCGL